MDLHKKYLVFALQIPPLEKKFPLKVMGMRNTKAWLLQIDF